MIVRKSEIVAADMDGETVMMNIETGKYYNLGAIGGAIWKLIETPTKVEDLISRLVEEYNVTRNQCEEDVLPFLNQIFEQSLIKKI